MQFSLPLWGRCRRSRRKRLLNLAVFYLFRLANARHLLQRRRLFLLALRRALIVLWIIVFLTQGAAPSVGKANLQSEGRQRCFSSHSKYRKILRLALDKSVFLCNNIYGKNLTMMFARPTDNAEHREGLQTYGSSIRFADRLGRPLVKSRFVLF